MVRLAVAVVESWNQLTSEKNSICAYYELHTRSLHIRYRSSASMLSIDVRLLFALDDFFDVLLLWLKLVFDAVLTGARRTGD